MSATDRSVDELAAKPARALRSPGYETLVYGVLVVWVLGDLVSTYFAMAAAGGAWMEVNPLMRALIGVDPLLLVVLKAAVALAVGISLLSFREIIQRVPWWRAWFTGLILAGTLVTLNNLAVGGAALR